MGAQQIMNVKVKALVWENFKARFLEKYFPNSVKFAREQNFSSWSRGRCLLMFIIQV